MESLPNYDNWKTTPPEYEEHPIAHCGLCGRALYEGGGILDVFGDMWCEDCMNDNRRVL